MLDAREFPVVHGTSPSRRVSNRIGIDFANECVDYGFPLDAPTVTLSSGVTPSGGNNPTDSATAGSPTAPPTGIPSNAPSADFGGPSTTPSPSQGGPTSSTTGSVGSGVRVVKKAEVICVFSVCLTAVLVLY